MDAETKALLERLIHEVRALHLFVRRQFDGISLPPDESLETFDPRPVALAAIDRAVAYVADQAPR